MALVIRESAIHARGCYTTEAIKRNALIIEYVGSRISNNEANDLYDDYEQTYLFGLEDGKTIIDGYGVAAFINHSCRPNCRTDEFKGHIWIIADRNIKAGEELTYDYRLSIEGRVTKKVRAALETTKGFVGTAGVFTFTPADHNGLDVDAFEMVTVKDGKFVLLGK